MPANDPRLLQEDRRIEVIKAQIALERKNLGLGTSTSGDDPTAFANLVGEYERLAVEQQFAEQTYTAAMAAYDARAEPRRQSRYLRPCQSDAGASLRATAAADVAGA